MLPPMRLNPLLVLLLMLPYKQVLMLQMLQALLMMLRKIQ